MNIDDTTTTLTALLPHLARLGAPRNEKTPRLAFEPCFTGGWRAYDENTYDGPDSPIGYGETKREAAEDYLEQYESRRLEWLTSQDDKSERDDTLDFLKGRDWQ